MTDHLYLDNQGVFITRVQRFRHGTKVGYKVYVEYDGMEQPPFEDFVELELLLEATNHAKPERTFGAITEMNHIKAILVGHGNTYRIGTMIASDGSKVTRQQVLEEQKAKREARTTTNEHKSMFASGMSVMEQIAATQSRLKAEREALRFGHGQALIRWHLTKNPYYLIEVNGEYQLTTRESRLVA